MLAKRLLFAGVSATAMIATNAFAIDLLNSSGDLFEDTLPYPVSDNQTANSITGDLEFRIAPSSSFPSGSLLLSIDLGAGSTFAVDVVPSADLLGGGGCAPMNISLSTGGSKGDSSVSLFVDNLDSCDAGANDLAFALSADVSGNTTVGVTLQTVGGLPVDGNGPGNPATLELIRFVPPVIIDIIPDTDKTEATLASSFMALSTAGMADNDIGTIIVDPNNVNLDNMPGGDDVANNTIAGGGDEVAVGDYDVDVVLVGNFSAFDDGPMASTAGVSLGTVGPVDPDATSGDIELNNVPGADLDVAGAPVLLVANGTDAIARTSVEATVTVDFSGAQSDVSSSGALQSISRQGTQIVFPWVSSGTQAAATGTTNVFRCANITGTASGAVFASILNSSALPASSFPAVTQIASGIPANGELVVNSQGLENALGVDFARADIELTIEENADDLTCRRFIVRSEGVQSLGAGTVDQEKDALP